MMADEPCKQITGRAEISDPPGEAMTLTLFAGEKALAELQIGPAEAIALASDLLLSARRRYGRPPAPTDKL